MKQLVIRFVTIFFPSYRKRHASNFSVMNSNSCMQGCMNQMQAKL